MVFSKLGYIRINDSIWPYIASAIKPYTVVISSQGYITKQALSQAYYKRSKENALFHEQFALAHLGKILPLLVNEA